MSAFGRCYALLLRNARVYRCRCAVDANACILLLNATRNWNNLCTVCSHLLPNVSFIVSPCFPSAFCCARSRHSSFSFSLVRSLLHRISSLVWRSRRASNRITGSLFSSCSFFAGARRMQCVSTTAANANYLSATRFAVQRKTRKYYAFILIKYNYVRKCALYRSERKRIECVFSFPSLWSQTPVLCSRSSTGACFTASLCLLNG